MENKIFSKFNIYDQIGYLLVGSICLLVIVFNLIYFHRATIPEFNYENFLVWFVVAYFLGHFAQGIANIINDIKPLRFLLPEDKNKFDDPQKIILQEAREYFGLKSYEDEKIWNLCYILASAKDLSGKVQAFNSYYSLYRGWLMIFLFESLYLLVYLILCYQFERLLLLLVSILFSIIFFRRARRFWYYTQNKVLDNFIIIKKLNI